MHTCADISFAADTIAAFLSRAQTWAPKPRLGHPAEKTTRSGSLVKRGERSCGDWLEGIENKNRREIRRNRSGSGEKPGEDPAGPHHISYIYIYHISYNVQLGYTTRNPWPVTKMTSVVSFLWRVTREISPTTQGILTMKWDPYVWAKKNGYCLGLIWLPWMESVLHPQLWGQRTTDFVLKEKDG